MATKKKQMKTRPTASKGEWALLLNAKRRKGKTASPEASEVRTELERDYDRILFSTPVRRLADKTQVFPLERNDSVRTRLTHSHEVSNLARSIGTALAFRYDVASGVQDSQRNLPAVLAAVGLAHDLGNPPFGHQGEAAIQSWFDEHSKDVLEKGGLTKQQRLDFLRFEGNAQSFRLLTRLQLLNNNLGLDLTYATLAALMKYPTPSDKTTGSSAASKKHGFFFAEQAIAEEVLRETGLSIGKRHPLAYVMEACDDTAYVVLDVEDTVKKGLASYADVIAYLKHHLPKDKLAKRVIDQSEGKHMQYRAGFDLSPAELNDVSMQRFRVFAIGGLVHAATATFVADATSFVRGESEKGLLERGDGWPLRGALKEFSLRHAYRHRSVLKVELKGHHVLRQLMDYFWAAIIDREDPDNPASRRRTPFSRLVYERISENYKRVFEQPDKNIALPMRYRECLLLTDMISGMTDRFAMDLCAELIELNEGAGG